MPTRKKRIQVVEDDIIVAKDIEESLRSFGYDITSMVATGEDAIKDAEIKNPDLVLMDIRLKGEMDGIQAAEEIRKRLNIPVIYLTAYSDEKTLQRAKITEPFGYILKPFEERMLYTVIEMALYRHDIETKLRNLKEYNENIIESMPLGIVVVDMDKRITSVNKTQEDMFGAKKEDLIGKQMYSCYMESIKDVMSPLLQRSMTQGREVSESNVGYVDEEQGKDYMLEISISPLLVNQKIDGAVIATKDITDKRRLKERVRILEKKDLMLNENDKRVLYGLVRFPEYNNIKLSKKLGLKRTTFTSIKNKLTKMGFYSTARLVDLSAIGYEFLSIEYGDISVGDPEDAKSALKEKTESPEYFCLSATESEYYALSAVKDISESWDEMEMQDTENGNGTPVRNLRTMHYSLSRSSIENFFDYADLLKAGLKIDEEDKAPRKRKNDKPEREYTKNESKVLFSMAKYPDMSDREIAEKIDLSTVTVGQTRRKLMREGDIRTVRIPSLKKLGYGLIVLVRARMNSSGDPGRKEILERGKALKPVFYMLDKRNVFMICAFKNFAEYSAAFDGYIKAQDGGELFSEEPKTMIIPAEKISVQKLDFSSLVRKTFGLGKEF